MLNWVIVYIIDGSHDKTKNIIQAFEVLFPAKRRGKVQMPLKLLILTWFVFVSLPGAVVKPWQKPLGRERVDFSSQSQIVVHHSRGVWESQQQEPEGTCHTTPKIKSGDQYINEGVHKSTYLDRSPLRLPFLGNRRL